LRVRTRLVLFGAALPACALLAAVIAAGGLFRYSLFRSLDRALLANAAVESVSLFDGPMGEPHLHLGKSPLANDVRSFVPAVALYKASGELVSHFPENAKRPEFPAPYQNMATPELVSRTTSDGRVVRALSVSVRAPWGDPFVLALESPIAEIEATMGLYWRTTLGLVAAVSALLFVLQWRQAGRMSGRIVDMTAYLPKLRGGELEWSLPADDTRDEVAELRVALSEAMERLREARDAQERLIANAAHELRTPLGLMRTEMDLALRKERSAEELRHALSEARSEVLRLSELAARLLDLAALGKVTWNLSQHDLASLLREAAEACEAEAEARSVTLALDLPDEAFADIDRQTMRQAIDNYLSNALVYSPPGSTIHIALRNENEERDERDERKEESWVISVHDEGSGVDPAEAERIFEPFYRGADAKRRGSGAGLGLSIVREITRRHGGRAFVDETKRGGATFVMTIPRR